MSRLNELKKQYPELNVSFFDILQKLDTSKSYKYLPLLCKIFGRRFNFKKEFPDSFAITKLDVEATLINKGISTNSLSDNELYVYHTFMDFFPNETFYTFKEFIHYIENNQITNNDVTSYSTIDELRGAITLASIKEWNKELESQIIKEYEDDRWIGVRPLTFSASAKYGAGTRWCTTYQKEKLYFEKYWRQGILVYFINKKTGYKFAGFRDLTNKEMSFWNAADNRVDYLDLEIDDYMFTNVRKIFSSELSNKNLSSNEIQDQVHKECLDGEAKVREINVVETIPVPVEVPDIREIYVEEGVNERQYIEEVPRMNALVQAARMYNEVFEQRG